MNEKTMQQSQAKLDKCYAAVNKAYGAHAKATRNDWATIVAELVALSGVKTADGGAGISREVYGPQLVRFTLAACEQFGFPVELGQTTKQGLKINIKAGEAIDAVAFEQCKSDARSRWNTGLKQACRTAKVAMPLTKARTKSAGDGDADKGKGKADGVLAEIKWVDVLADFRQLESRLADFQNMHAAHFTSGMIDDHGRIVACVKALHAKLFDDGKAPAERPDSTQTPTTPTVTTTPNGTPMNEVK